MDINFQKSFIDLFAVEERLAQTISQFFTEESLLKGSYFLRQGKKCDRLSFIQSGIVRVFRETESKQITQWIGSAGYFVTDLSSFLFEESARYSIQAINDVQIFSIYKKDYILLGQQIADWHNLEKRFIAKCFIQLEDRICDFISLTAEERYYLYFQSNKTLFNQVPLQYIASVLGMSAETLSRIRAKSIS